MPGGHERRHFFYSQVRKYKEGLANELPVSDYSAEEETAGFKRLNETFGFYATLDNIARYLGCSDQEALRLTVREFYTKVKYLAWRSHCQK